mgnify:FL=1
MEKKRVVFTIITIFVAIIIIVTVLVFPERVADANSAQRYFEGIDSTGALVTMENCPIVVDKEDLDFYVEYTDDAPSRDDVYYAARFGYVTATYTFRNPSENTINMDVVFPYGYAPKNDKIVEKECSVKVDGEDVAWKKRYTLKEYYRFNAVDDMQLIKDGFDQDEYFYTDKKVYKYVYSVNDNVNGRKLEFQFASSSDRKIVTDYYSYSGSSTLYVDTVGKQELTFYVIGEDLDLAACEETVINEQKGGHLTLVSRTEQTFGDELAFINRPKDSDISDVDWYNALSSKFDYVRNVTVFSPQYLTVLGIDGYNGGYELFRWCQYTLSIAPGQSVVNAVTVPLFPSVDVHYDPDVYEFTYYLSPATTWAGFKDLTVNIHTNGYVLKYKDKGFEKVDGKYTYHTDTLPSGELTFKVCKEEKPTTQYGRTFSSVIILLAKVIGFGVLLPVSIALIVIVIIVIVKAVKRKKNKEIDKNEQTNFVPVNKSETNVYTPVNNVSECRQQNEKTVKTDGQAKTEKSFANAQTVIESEENDENVVHSETDGNSMKSDLKNTDESSDAYKFW